jgi:nucleotide-binding universal stress UspA family protein
MPLFRNILVGIDPSRCEGPDAGALGLVAERAVRRGIWLARAENARLTFFAALAESGLAWKLFDMSRPPPADRPGLPPQVLEGLLERARAEGVEAQAVTATGKGWVEIIRQVLRGGHDLAVVGAKDEKKLRHALFGNTTQKLLHQCPCPVWVTRSKPGGELHNVLIASDLSPLADIAVRLGLAVARLAGARVHLLHAVDYPLEHHWSTGQPEPWADAYRRQLRAEAQRQLRAQLERCAPTEGPVDAVIHLTDEPGVPDEAILQFIPEHAIDLLVLATAAHAGLARLLIGNTAERLLPEVPCALLAVKSPEFRTSVLPG